MSTLSARVAALTALIDDRWPRGTEARLCDELARVLPRTIRVMSLAAPDGWPTSTPGAPDRGGSSSGGYDRLGGLVARREAASDAYSSLCHHVGVAALCVAQNDRKGVQGALQRALAQTDDWHMRLSDDEKRKARERAQCSKTVQGDPTGAPWVDDHCVNIADVGRKGLCEACYRRRFRYLEQMQERVS